MLVISSIFKIWAGKTWDILPYFLFTAHISCNTDSCCLACQEWLKGLCNYELSFLMGQTIHLMFKAACYWHLCWSSERQLPVSIIIPWEHLFFPAGNDGSTDRTESTTCTSVFFNIFHDLNSSVHMIIFILCVICSYTFCSAMKHLKDLELRPVPYPVALM